MKRLLSLLLCAAILLSLLPGALAVEVNTNQDGTEIKIEANSEKGDGLDTIHEALKNLADTEDCRVIIRLKGIFSGQLCIPDRNLDVIVEGVNRAVLNGGIQNNTGICEVQNLTLTGAGKAYEKWPDSVVYNYGLYGGGSFKVFNCTLDGFYHGMDWHGQRIVAEGCTFVNCDTAIYVDNTQNMQEAALMENVFEENATAIHVNQCSWIGPAWLINRNAFLNNDLDVKNDTQSRFFFAGCYSPRKVLQYEGFVSAYPMAEPVTDGNNAVTTFRYNYASQNPIFVAELQSGYGYNNGEFAELYHVPANALDGLTFWTVDDRDNRSVILAFPASETASTDTTLFDPFVGKNVQNNGMTVELYVNNLPEGKVPTVTIETDTPWINVTLHWKQDGNSETVTALPAPTVQGNQISFQATQGGGVYILDGETYQGEPVTQNQLFVAERMDDLATGQLGPKPFYCDLDADGIWECYYLAPVFWVNNEPPVVTKSVSIPAGGPPFSFYADFFTKDRNGSYEPVGESVQAQLEEAFGDTLTLELLAMREGVYYPVESDHAPSLDKPCFQSWQFDRKNCGFWVVRVRGTVNGTAVSARMIFESAWYGPETTIVHQPETEAEAQKLLDHMQTIDGVTQQLVLPAGTLDWDLTIPATIRELEIYGAPRKEDSSVNETILKGTITANNESVKLFILDLQGDGSNNQNNVGITGTARVRYQGCVFANYREAIHTTGFCLEGAWTTFRNNKTALVVDLPENGGNGFLMGCRFENNQVAVQFKQFPDKKEQAGIAPVSFSFKQCTFADNEHDVKNGTSRSIFIPHALFLQNGQVSRVRACGNVELTAELLEADTSGAAWQVYDYPTALDATFTRYDYTSDTAPVLSSGEAYQIPASALDGRTFTILDGEGDVLAALTLGEEETAPFMASRMLMEAEEEAVCSPSVVLTQLPGGAMAVDVCTLPDGKTATVSVNSNENLVRVRDDDGQVQGGYQVNDLLTFRADHGGSYLLDPCSQLIQAAYNADGKMLGVASSENGVFTPLEQSGDTAKVSWFFLDETYRPLP